MAVTDPRTVHPAGGPNWQPQRRVGLTVVDALPFVWAQPDLRGQRINEVELGHRVATASDDPMWVAYRLVAAYQPDHVRFAFHERRAA